MVRNIVRFVSASSICSSSVKKSLQFFVDLTPGTVAAVLSCSHPHMHSLSLALCLHPTLPTHCTFFSCGDFFFLPPLCSILCLKHYEVKVNMANCDTKLHGVVIPFEAQSEAKLLGFLTFSVEVSNNYLSIIY